MGTPKKNTPKKPASNSGTKKSSGLHDNAPQQKRHVDDDDFDEQLDDLDGYESFNDYDDDDDDDY